MSTYRMLGLVAALAACGARPVDSGASREATPAPPVPVAEVVSEPVIAPAFPEDMPSVYELPLRLRDSHDREVGLDVGRGHPVLVSMFYASCPVACPLLIEEIRQVAAELPPAVQDDLRIVLVSFDPERDTPQALRALSEARKLDERWTVAAASDLDARTLAAVLGFKYRKLDNGEFFHSSTIVALDRDGRPVARTDVLRQRAALLAALR